MRELIVLKEYGGLDCKKGRKKGGIKTYDEQY